MQLDSYQLKGTPLSGIFPKDILSTFKVENYQKGEAVLLAGAEISYLYIVLSGRCVVKQLGEDGQETILGYVHAGDLVGEIELFTHHLCLHYVYADSAAELLAIPKSQVTEEAHCQL